MENPMTYAHPEFLVDTDWVSAHTNDPKVRIIESDEDPLLYRVGHIPARCRWTGSARSSIRCGATS